MQGHRLPVVRTDIPKRGEPTSLSAPRTYLVGRKDYDRAVLFDDVAPGAYTLCADIERHVVEGVELDELKKARRQGRKGKLAELLDRAATAPRTTTPVAFGCTELTVTHANMDVTVPLVRDEP